MILNIIVQIFFKMVKTKFDINLKNLNSIGKSSSKYKSSPQIEMVSLFNTEVSLPLVKNTEIYKFTYS